MPTLYMIRDNIKAFYAKFDTLVSTLVRFLVVFVAVIVINGNIGYKSGLSNPLLALIIGLVGALVPYSVSCLLLSAYVVVHIASVSLEFALLLGCFIFIAGLLHYSLKPNDSVLLILVPLSFVFKIPYVVPILIGLGGGFLSIISVSMGVAIYYLCSYIKQHIGTVANAESLDISQRYLQMIDGVFSDKTMFLMMVAFAITILIVYIIRRLSIDYAWQIAITGGALSLLLIVFLGEFLFGISLSVLGFIASLLLSLGLALVYNFFVFSVDYSRTEYTQFEDDDYYYYVKAVPKISLRAPDIKVQKFNISRTDRRRVRDSESKE